MAAFWINGGVPLFGSVHIGGAKNAALPILAATLLTTGEVRLTDCPKLLDVDNMLGILTSLGAECTQEDALVIDTAGASAYNMPEGLSKEVRSSIFMLGPLLSRNRRAVCTFPGGCEIGNRPIDLHLFGLKSLGVKIIEEHGKIICDGANMHGAVIHLDYPSVGATENIMMAAIMARGETIIHNAAREPEIECLQRFLTLLGYKVYGAGTSVIKITGNYKLSNESVEYSIMPDRIVAGTLLTAVAIAGGNAELTNVVPEQIGAVISKLQESGSRIDITPNSVIIKSESRPKALRRLETLPYPGFPTDMQAQFFALCAIANGTSVIVENVFENRFKHGAELVRMGAQVVERGNMAIISGVGKLHGADVIAWDLRGGAALTLAGLAAEGETRVSRIELIDRGYEKFEHQLSALGAKIIRK